MRHRITLPSALVCVLAACGESPSPVGPPPTGPASLKRDAAPAAPRLLTTGLQGAQGSAVGPGGALFVTEPFTGSIWRIDPRTGARTLFASGLPAQTEMGGIGSGVVDVAFIGRTAYALVTGVGPDLEGDDVVGIYRVDGPTAATAIADIGAFSAANPPDSPFLVQSGFQYALEPYRDGFLVTDGHHNRVLYVTRDGEISVFRAFANIVPTGMDASGNTVYMTEAGPIPHLPENGKVVAFGPKATTVTEIASGIRLAVDVEFGRGRTLFALSQGFWDGAFEGAPAEPKTGALMRINGNGTLTTVVDALNQPISLQIIQNTAYVVTLGGEIWTIDNIAGPPFGRSVSIDARANGNSNRD
jgi:sugar lactone lactonase YvrE